MREFFRVKNYIAEALAKTSLTEREGRVLWAIMRLTWGWGGTEWEFLSLKRLAVETALPKNHISTALGRLIRRNIVQRGGSYKRRELRVNPEPQTWLANIPISGNNQHSHNGNLQHSHKRELQSPISGNNEVPQAGTMKSKKRDNHAEKRPPKDTSSKDTSSKTLILKSKVEKKPTPKHPETEALCKELLAAVKTRLPETASTVTRAWLEDMDFLIRRYGPELTGQVLRWSQDDSFWRANIRSPQSLRKQFETLLAKMREAPKRGSRREPDDFSTEKEGFS